MMHVSFYTCDCDSYLYYYSCAVNSDHNLYFYTFYFLSVVRLGAEQKTLSQVSKIIYQFTFDFAEHEYKYRISTGVDELSRAVIVNTCGETVRAYMSTPVPTASDYVHMT